MTIFRYVEDKDVFQRFYSKMLANRLVKANSASDDAEVNSKMRTQLYAYTFVYLCNITNHC